MLQGFRNFIDRYRLFDQDQKLLLALSGGKDSVCLFHLLCEAGYDFSVAHCNFKLRGEESDADEQFVIALAESKNIPCHTISFETGYLSTELKMGIQELARKLRYDWFFGLVEQHGYEKLLTAHHRTDNLETMLINVLRSSGVRGLHGIPLNENSIVRPMMFATREEIDQYMTQSQLAFREDRSNAGDDYLRNNIRHFVLPAIKNVRSDAERRFFETAMKVKGYENIADELMKKEWEHMVERKNEQLWIHIGKLNAIEHLVEFLYYNLRSYGFKYGQIEDLLESGQTGKRIISEKFQIVKEREHYVLSPVISGMKESIVLDERDRVFAINGLIIDFQIIENSAEINLKEKGRLSLNADRIAWPVRIRPWERGDKLIPLGMKGYKKISDILTDNKVPNLLRDKAMVVECADNELIALLPETLHDHFKIVPGTRKVLSLGIKIADT